MTDYPEETILTSCRVFVDLGLAVCHADGTLQKSEGKTLAEELKRLLTSLGASSTIRAQMPSLLAEASGKFGKGKTANARDAALGAAITTGQSLPDPIKKSILAALDEIAGSDGDHDSAESELIDRIRSAWAAPETTTESEDWTDSDADRFLAAAAHVLMIYLHVRPRRRSHRRSEADCCGGRFHAGYVAAGPRHVQAIGQTLPGSVLRCRVELRRPIRELPRPPCDADQRPRGSPG